MFKRLFVYILLLVICGLFIFNYLKYKELSSQTSSYHQLSKPQLMIGFRGTAVSENIFEETKSLIESAQVRGLIFFDRNIVNKQQLSSFIKNIRSIKNGTELLLAIDEEGGLVSRLSSGGVFPNIAPAEDIGSKMSLNKARQLFLQRAIFLKDMGFDLNFAPVVDVAVNSTNSVIVGSKRSYSASPNLVIAYAKQFIKAHRSNGIMTVIKHYPGHGSSKSDSHKGFTDITETFISDELRPYQQLIAENMVDGVMVGHLFDRRVDSEYPASISSKHVSDNLRAIQGFRGLVFTDDLQMGAIAKNYDLVEATKLAIASGSDVMMFANFYKLSKVVKSKILSLF